MAQILKTAVLPEVDVRVRTFVLTMRHSGLRISDTTALACVSLTADDHLQLYQAKTGEYVSVLLPTFVADALRKSYTETLPISFGQVRPSCLPRYPCGVSGWPMCSKRQRSRMATAIDSATPSRWLCFRMEFHWRMCLRCWGTRASGSPRSTILRGSKLARMHWIKPSP